MLEVATLCSNNVFDHPLVLMPMTSTTGKGHAKLNDR